MNEKSPVGQNVTSMPDTSDRITEAYNGILGADFMRSTKERVHWLASNASGSPVLDVGCSQGIGPILLGRENKSVIGVDVSQASITQAIGFLKTESAAVQKNVKFICADFLTLEFDKKFETVVLGEVLEHLIHPDQFIARAAELLSNDGRIVVSVPFGINDFHDHKQTFYLTGPFELIVKHFDIVEIKFFGKWLGIVGVKRHGEAEPRGLTIDTNQIRESEKAFFSIERKLVDQVNVLNGNVAKLNQQILDLKTQATVNLQEEIKKTRAQIERERNVIIEDLNGLLKQTITEKQSLERSNSAVENTLKKTVEAKDELDKRVGAVNSALEHTTSQKDALEQTLATERAKIKALEQNTAALERQLRDLKQHNNSIVESFSFSLGQAIVKARSPVGLLRLPKEIAKAISKRRNRDKPRALTAPEKSSGPASPASQKASTTSPTPVVKDADVNIGAIGWPLPPTHAPVTAMSVLDKFSRSCFAPSFNLVEPRPDNWEALLDRDKPSFLLAESSWQGNEGSWQYRVAHYANPPGNEFSEMVAEFKRRGLPTVFWNKEDPVHFENFKSAAKQFDVVLTTAIEATEKYKELGVKSVSVLPFACEPTLHNPKGSAQRNGRVAFAGSYYANRFADRRREQEDLLDAAKEFELDIFDRTGATSADFAFPERFSANIRGSLPYDEMCKAYGKYSVFLNVNSVIDSRTMFSRRVFELLAVGTPIVSTPSKGIAEMFGDLVWLVKSKEEAAEAINTLLTDSSEWRRRSIQGIRAALSKHTSGHRSQSILDAVGINSKVIEQPDVLAFGIAASQNEANQIQTNFAKQQFPSGRKRLAIFGLSSDIAVESNNDTILITGEPNIWKKLGQLISDRNHTHLVSVPAAGVCGQHYLEDLYLATNYVEPSLIGKPRASEDSYKYNVLLEPDAWMLPSELLSTQLEFVEFNADAMAEVMLKSGHHSFAIDSANFIRDGWSIHKGRLESLISREFI
ncbi:glycosyltransferase [Phyllobacterium sp. CCNWLW109]|uniref:glycosyltransferase family protein n=1 Tax=Phyllobacterium sp. CCNWLW109 TaxID=3127479 RepID=UPI003077DBF7